MQLLCVVEDHFEISGKGTVITPGIPAQSGRSVKTGDIVVVRRPHLADIQTHVAGTEMISRPISAGASAKQKPLSTPILLGDSIRTRDVPKGTEIWIEHDKQD